MPRCLFVVGLQKPNLLIVSTESMGIPFFVQKMISIYISIIAAHCGRLHFVPVWNRGTGQQHFIQVVNWGALRRVRSGLHALQCNQVFASGRLIFSLEMRMRVDPCDTFLAFFLRTSAAKNFFCGGRPTQLQKPETVKHLLLRTAVPMHHTHLLRNNTAQVL